MAKNKQVQELIAVLLGLCVVIMFFGFYPQISSVLGLPTNIFKLGSEPVVPPPPNMTDPSLAVPLPPVLADQDWTQNERVLINNGSHTFEDGTHTITGSISTPTPCYDLSEEIRIAESFPEQVFIDFFTTPPSDDIMCAQVIAEKEFNISYEASENASLIIRVNGQPGVLGLE